MYEMDRESLYPLCSSTALFFPRRAIAAPPGSNHYPLVLIHELMVFVGRQSKSTWKDSRELNTSTVNQAFIGDFCGVKTLASWIVAVKSYSFYYYEYITSNYDHFSKTIHAVTLR